MTFWVVREELSNADRLRRSYYELLRDELNHFILNYTLTESYKNFINNKIPYPFVERRELKPRARIPSIEYDCHNTFLLIFVEDTLPPGHKKYIKYFKDNKTTKTNLLKANFLPVDEKINRNHKYLESVHFYDFLIKLLPVDYALLIQRDPLNKARDKYHLSHFHVRIDWPIADAAESLAQNLRYISQDLYEKGEKYAEDVQKKLFEYYGLPSMAGGRRTAGIVASQYTKSLPCITTVYIGSSETRALIRISERGTSKSVLLKLSKDEISQLAETNMMSINEFIKNYVIFNKTSDFICIFQTTYNYTQHAKPPEDGKLRDINPDLSWLSVGAQHVLPIPGKWNYSPLSFNIIYT